MAEGFSYEGTIAVIGGGRMGEAIVRGLLAVGLGCGRPGHHR